MFHNAQNSHLMTIKVKKKKVPLIARSDFPELEMAKFNKKRKSQAP